MFLTILVINNEINIEMILTTIPKNVSIKILLFMLIHMASSIYLHYDIIVSNIGGKIC